MPRNPLYSGQNRGMKKVNFDELSFFDGIINDQYILVVGSGVILDREKYPGTNGDINVYLLNELNSIKHTNFDSLSDIVQAFSTEISPLYSYLVDGIVYEIDDISPELSTLLNTRYFKFVFSTTPDHYIETLMKAIWDNKLRVVNFSDEKSMRTFYSEIQASNGEYDKPTLLYVFGKAIKGQQNPTKFMETDSDAIKYIEEWIKLETDNPLISFLKKKRIFSIGCNFDDWYHRFFWHILTYNFVRYNTNDNKNYNDNAVLGHKTGKLEEYLSHNNVCVHSDSWVVINYLNHMLIDRTKEDVRFIDMLKNKTLEGKVFISYKTDPDQELAQNIFDILSQRTSMKLWYDNSDLLGGQPYNKRIPEAIRFSQVFVPILTKAAAEVLNSHETEELMLMNISNGLPFFIQEWKWASQVNGMTIIPIAFDGYNLKGPEHQKFESIVYGDNVSEHPSGIEMGSIDNIETSSIKKLIKSIYIALGIHE